MRLKNFHHVIKAFSKAILNRDLKLLKVLVLKSLLELYAFIFAPFFLLPYIIIRLIAKIYLVRFGILISERIGHLAANTDLYISKTNAKINLPTVKYKDLWTYTYPVSNKQLLKMFKERIIILSPLLVKPFLLLNKVFPGGKKHNIENDSDRDLYNFWENKSPNICLTQKEEAKGKEEIEKIGLPHGAKFICLVVRDSAYLKTFLPWNDWSYHDFRDSDIKNFIPAIEELTKLGYYVVRMGRICNEKIASNNPKIIDYAFCEHKSDFLDIYLASKCTFCITNCTGFDAVPTIFRKPICSVDLIPVSEVLSSSSQFLSIFSLLYSHQHRRILKMSEMTRAEYQLSKGFAYKNLGLEVVKNSKEEIKDVVLEMERRVSKIWFEKDANKKLQEIAWSYINSSSHGKLKIGHFGAKFLEKHTKLIS